MKPLYPMCKSIDLHVKGRVQSEDARRQEETAQEILVRLRNQPGVVLADEVGMGKTFVALAVAVSTALANRGKRPVVVMVPPSLSKKWPDDYGLFREKCIPASVAQHVQHGTASRAVELLKLLDDPPERRKSILFVTHGAMSRGLNDPWVMLAIIRQALHGRHGVGALRKALSRAMPSLLRMGWTQRYGEELWIDLLTTTPDQWLAVLQEWEIDPERKGRPDKADDPVPRTVLKALPHLDTSGVYDALSGIPLRRSKNYQDNVAKARCAVVGEVRGLWETCVRMLGLRLPLLILDEAHHLKNDETRLASLFRMKGAHDDAEDLTHGPLAGVFERMLFLTATPFQLGHSELCSVLDRFGSIRWSGVMAPGCGEEGSRRKREALRAALDSAQQAAVTLDKAWGRLRAEDLLDDGQPPISVESWWKSVHQAGQLTPKVSEVVGCYRAARERLGAAEELLKPWVIRHRKARYLSHEYAGRPRRCRLVGQAILMGDVADPTEGIQLEGDAVLPFLLAARASSQAPESRPVYAEGLASSYEAFLHTRMMRKKGHPAPGQAITEEDDDGDGEGAVPDAMAWYLDELEALVPRGDAAASASHPKVAATVARVVDTWRAGEKVVVFCHYVATGRTLRQRISEAIRREIEQLGAQKLRCRASAAGRELERIGQRFFDRESPIRRACDAEVAGMLQQYPLLTGHAETLLGVVRRNVRTPSFLVRFFPLGVKRLDARLMARAMDHPYGTGLTLRKLLTHFFGFLTEHCGDDERKAYIDAVNRMQTGTHRGVDVAKAYNPDEIQDADSERLIPNVRLVNGATGTETRQGLMAAFNTPFYPEVLIASSVMAEGVDLHLNCRYVIHHDLCWNPSNLEQRTGRIDRIGAKVERCGEPIHVYMPFVGETQDEKMYRVVMDRERWFNVVMGEQYSVGARSTEERAKRIEFPLSAAKELGFDLAVSR